MKSLFLLLAILTQLQVQAQTVPPKLALHLQPYRLKGGHFLHKNMAFANYKTRRFRRTLGSFFAAPSIQPANLLRIGGIPLYHKKLRWSKDVFRFDVYKEGQLTSTVECRATLLTNETFNLFQLEQDSSFFGARNEDLLEARIQLADQPSQYWEVVATNLNGSKQEAQKGIIRKDSTEIHFTRTFAVLKERPAQSDALKGLYSSIYNVYAFTYKQEVVATVTVDERGRQKKVWLNKNLDPTLTTVIANTAMLLTARRTIYK